MWYPPPRTTARVVPALLALAAACGGPGTAPPPAPWWDLLGQVAALARASTTANGVELVLPAGQAVLVARLCQAADTVALRLEAELLWRPEGKKPGGGVEFVVGPHLFGSRGYRIAVAEGPGGFAEARSPRLTPGAWHHVEVSAWKEGVELRLDGRLVCRSPAANPRALPTELAIHPGTRLVVKLLRLWKPSAGLPRPGGGANTLFVFPPDASPHNGRMVADGATESQRALEVRGVDLEAPVVWGHDATFGTGEPLVARFHLRGGQGTGGVRLGVTRANGKVLAERIVRLEELPTDSYRAVELEFRCEPGWVVSFEVAGETGVFRVGAVVVSSRGAAPARRAGAGAVERSRRARDLAEVWKPDRKTATALEFVRLERRLSEGENYEFRAVWRLRGSAGADDVGIDLWVACRDQWGLVWVFDCAAAYDRVEPGEHVSGAVMPSRLPRRYGPPVAFLAQVYRHGEPVASAWRKWGIPVDDKYIVGARRVGRLRRLPLIE